MIIGTKPAIKKLNDMVLVDMVINDKVIKRIKFARNLGLNYDEVLSWRRHINILIGRAIGKFKDLNRHKKFLTQESKKLLCDSIILSLFSFADIVFMNIDMYLQRKVQKIQDYCLNFIFNIKKREHVNRAELRKSINWLSMKDRRILNGLSLLYKTLNGKGPDYIRDMFTLVSEISERNTRTYPSNIWIPTGHVSAIHRKSFKFYIPKIWNSLPENIKNSNTIQTFKKKVKNALLQEEIDFPPP